MFKTAALAACVLCSILPAIAAGALSAIDLRVEHQTNPLGVDSKSPRLSWTVDSPERNQKQTAYEVLVADSSQALARNSGDLWDSGKVDGDQTIDIAYAGKPLTADTSCYWKVRVWDRDGHPSDFSSPALWTVGLEDSQWTSQWVGFDTARLPSQLSDAPLDGAQWIWLAGDAGAAPKGPRTFSTAIDIPDEKTIRRAILSAAATGSITFSINNYRCIATAPGGDTKVAYTADVTRDAKRGRNPLTAIVNSKVESSAFIAKLVIDYEDGSRQVAVTDGTWKAVQGAITGGGRAGGRGFGGFGARGAAGGPGGVGGTAGPGAAPQTSPSPPPPPPPPAIPGAPAAALYDYPDGPLGKLQTAEPAHTPPSYERGAFTVDKPVQSALLYVTALGLCDVHLNGKRVTDDLFIPGWTDFSKRVYYRTYDVTNSLVQGKNALGGILTDGWFSGYIGWDHHQDHYGKAPRFRAEIHIKYADGSTAVVGTGPDWKSNTGAITMADLQMGENYDARLDDGWDTADFDDSQWPAVAVGAELQPVVSWHPGPPVRGIAEFTPTEIAQPTPGVYVFNVGQYSAGAARLKITGEPGQEIVMRYAERTNPDGTIYVANLRLASATDRYICRGGGEEVYQPRFTFHGFQYVEVTGLKQPPTPDTITGIPYTSDTPLVSQFDTSDAMLNRLYKNVLWTQRANFIDIPTDCPQRDERQGWTGDAQVYCRTATLNTDVQGFFTKWTQDLADSQQPNGDFPSVAPLKVGNASGGTAWADAGVIVPWTVYYAYGDTGLLARQYPSMKKFVDFCNSKFSADGKLTGRWFTVGDHLAPGGNFSTNPNIIYFAYFARCALDVAKAADVLGMTDDAAKYHDLFNRIKTAFNRQFVNADGSFKGGTQTAYAMAVESNLLDDGQIKQAADFLAADIKAHDDHITTGFLGTRDLMLTLSKMGRNDLAYALIHQTTYPSWGFEIANGATSMWERWDGWTTDKGFEDPAMNSFAHYSFGAVYNWMLENIGGIRTDGPAYAKLIIAPQLDDTTTYANVGYKSVHGQILTSWKRDGSKLALDVTIPANTTATVIVPTDDPNSVTESGHALPPTDRKAVYAIGSGVYHFAASATVVK